MACDLTQPRRRTGSLANNRNPSGTGPDQGDPRRNQTKKPVDALDGLRQISCTHYNRVAASGRMALDWLDWTLCLCIWPLQFCLLAPFTAGPDARIGAMGFGRDDCIQHSFIRIFTLRSPVHVSADG